MNQILVIQGLKGVGKTTLSKQIVEDDDGFKLGVSLTSRDIRKGEVEGVDYNFTVNETIESLLADNKLVEYYYNEQDDYYYALPLSEFKCDENVVVVANPDGVQQLIDYFGRDKIKILHVNCPKNVRLKRIMDRDGLSKQIVNAQLKQDSKLFEQYDYSPDLIVSGRTSIADLSHTARSLINNCTFRCNNNKNLSRGDCVVISGTKGYNPYYGLGININTTEVWKVHCIIEDVYDKWCKTTIIPFEKRDNIIETTINFPVLDVDLKKVDNPYKHPVFKKYLNDLH